MCVRVRVNVIRITSALSSPVCLPPMPPPPSIHPFCPVCCFTSELAPLSSFVTVLIEMLCKPALPFPQEHCRRRCSHLPLFYAPTSFFFCCPPFIYFSRLYSVSVSQRSQLISMSANVKSLKVLQIDFFSSRDTRVPCGSSESKGDP